ncbi:MAG: type II toxin-antitoxin system HipA family toxin [Desulfovibrio sp.]|nr:type II toxin-antitoxin system HipA family toxin [Desulfovibrio sp.]
MIALDVFLNGTLAGHLHSDTNDRFTFRYSPGYIQQKGLALSCSLPLRAEEFSYQEARPFFAGVLPEESSRDMVADRLNIARNNDIKLANAIGGDCAGAVSLLPAGQEPLPEGRSVVWLNADAFALVLRHLAERSLLAPGDHVRISLAGAMCKLTLCHDGERFGIPDENTPSTHIIKPGRNDLDDLVYNECFCARLAAKAGLAVARTSVLEHAEGTFLLIERYDRHEGSRIHQEDFCQALGYVPNDKYQSGGGPGFRECYALLHKHVTRPAEAVNMLTRAVIFNILIGNNDAHAKNFSLLHHADGKTTLAPLYDLVSTEIYQQFRNGDMAMKFGGTYDFKWVNKAPTEKMARDIGVSPAGLRRVMLLLCTDLPPLAQRCAADMGRPVGHAIAELVGKRAQLLLERLR